MNLAEFTIHLCNILCIIPPITCKNNNISTKKFHSYYAMATSVIILVLYGFSSYFRFNKEYKTIDPVIAFLDQLAQTSFTLTVLMSSIDVTFFSETFQDFFKKLSHKDGSLDWMNSLRNLKFFLIFNTGLFVTLGVDIVFWLRNIGINNYILRLLKSFQFYQNGLNVYMLVCFCDALKNHFKHNKKNLIDFMESGRKDNSLSFSGRDFLETDNLRELRKSQGLLLDLIPHFNCIFGRNILYTIFNCIVNTILFTSLALMCIMNSFKVGSKNYEADHWLYLTCGCWIVESLAFPIMLATVCESSVREAGKIVSICVNYLNELPTIPKTQELQLVKANLEMMLEQATIKKPVFSAGGFFVVDYTMLGLMVGSVTSYIIVVLQFVK